MSEDEYIPFGEEWRKLLMRLTKGQLIELLKKAYIKLQEKLQ